MNDKICLAVLYGGMSGEHEVSLKSAASVIRHIDRDRFAVIPVGIDKRGTWRAGDLAAIDAAQAPALTISPDAPEVRLVPGQGGAAELMLVSGGTMGRVDVVFPVVHGPHCEDGTLQGLLDLVGVAYVGSGVMSSAVGMDKDMSKRLIAFAGLPVAPYLVVTRRQYDADPDHWAAASREALKLPVFVKPCNNGSSVGIHKVKLWEDLGAALADAFAYDAKVLIEQGIDAREIEVAVLDGDPPFSSLASEINASPSHEFYSYAAKYLDQDGATVDLPARLSGDEMTRVQGLARDAFLALECNGLARVDFFLDRATGEFFFNEINTLPGFTAISMYPKMMEASGVPYPDLLGRLVDLARERHAQRCALTSDYRA